MSSDNESLKKDPIGAQRTSTPGSYEEFLTRTRGCFVIVDDILRRFPETRSSVREVLLQKVRTEYPNCKWASETICRFARKIQNDWGQYQADDATQATRAAEEGSWRRWAVEETTPPTTESVTANTPRTSEAIDETSEREANAAWSAIVGQFQKYRHLFGDEEALSKIAVNVEAYDRRFEDAFVLTHALGEAAAVEK